MRWSTPPVARLSPRNNVNVKMRHLLQAGHAVILIDRNTIRIESFNKRFRCSSDRLHNFTGLIIRQIQYRRRMTARDNEKLSDFKLPGIEQRKRLFCRIDNMPTFTASSNSFTNGQGSNIGISNSATVSLIFNPHLVRFDSIFPSAFVAPEASSQTDCRTYPRQPVHPHAQQTARPDRT